MLFSEFKSKEVINIRDCRRLGKVTDFEFDECKGIICKIIVTDGNKWLSICRPPYEVVIPYHDIQQIGPDLILVDINC